MCVIGGMCVGGRYTTVENGVVSAVPCQLARDAGNHAQLTLATQTITRVAFFGRKCFLNGGASSKIAGMSFLVYAI